MIKILRQWFLMIFIPLILKKNKIAQAYERSVLQLMSVLRRNEDKISSTSLNAILKHIQQWIKKKFIRLYTEHIHFLVTRAGWLVTNIYQHFTFEQAKFKKHFVVMNQKSRQKTTSPVERDFYKLLNNVNFRIDC